MSVYAVNFDGYLCEDAYPEIGEPRLDVIEHFKQLKKEGNKLILWTDREGGLMIKAVAWCMFQGLRFDAINTNLLDTIAEFETNPRKIVADYYCGDKNYKLPFENKMTADQYQKEFLKTLQPEYMEDCAMQLEYGVAKLSKEAGEVQGVFNKYKYQGHELDKDHLIEEVGDVLYHVCLIATNQGVKISEVFEKELKKCIERYPDGFSVERSINRNDSALLAKEEKNG